MSAAHYNRRATDRPRRPASLTRRTLDCVLIGAAFVLAAVLLTGCSSLPTSTLHRELAWQGLNVADAVQTSQYQHNDCHESDTWRYITGPEPSTRDTVIAASLTSLLHFGITFALDAMDAPVGMQNAWSYTTLGLTGGQVIYNASLGCE